VFLVLGLGLYSTQTKVVAFSLSAIPSLAPFHRQQQRRPFLSRRALFPSSTTEPSSKATSFQVGEEVGNGSYGTVHLCKLNDEKHPVIGKRSWTSDELKQRQTSSSPPDDPENNNQDFKEREERCNYYLTVEQHCFKKMAPHPQIPQYLGTFADEQHRSWMAFRATLGPNQKPAQTLDDVMKSDWKDQHQNSDQHHHLFVVQEALGLDAGASFGNVLLTLMESVLTVLTHVHSQGIVHRDLKPSNLLIDTANQAIVLIDFGSAADMEPISKNFWGGTTRIGLEDDRVAVSPIYAAPEIFIRPDYSPFAFDVFSAALILSQLIFNLLDERTDAGFHQQLEDAQFDLDAWLSRELSSKVRPDGLEEALEFLAEYPGLWRLLGDMLKPQPDMRVSSATALKRFHRIRDGDPEISLEEADGPFFASIVTMMETCEISPEGMGPRPLHYVATFRRYQPLGLVLAEAGQDSVEDPQWKEATSNAQPGEVFIQDIAIDSQAHQMGIFEVGDRLQSVGELPLSNQGFERVLDMLEQQPKKAKYVRLHFDRKSIRDVSIDKTNEESHVKVVEQGACSVKGKRQYQEDAFVLHEFHDGADIVLAGVFDGHGGTKASHAASKVMPLLTSEELRLGKDIRQALEDAWEGTCATYRSGCNDEECVADYDEREGALQANTGSTTLVAGTTASVVAVQEGKMAVLNCGDSRCVLVNEDGKVVFSTQDHTPQAEMERLQQGKDLGYSIPECSLSRWYLKVGDYQYAIARSLEGPFATSKGIVSEPDVVTLPSVPGVVILASDGLFEVMDNDEVGRDIIGFRKQGLSADQAARKLCSLALEKGACDNVSVVAIYLS